MNNTVIKVLRKPITSAIIAILIGFLVAAIVLASAGYDPGASFAALFSGMVGRPRYIVNVIIKATPLLFCGIAVAFAFKVGLFNIGAEGQYILGTVAATIVGITCDLPAVLEIPLVVLSGTIAGALSGALIGWLKAKFGIHEVITSIMFNWISLYLCNYVVSLDVFHQPNTTGTYAVHDTAFTMILPNWKLSDEGQAALANVPVLRDVLVRCDVNVGIIVAVVAAVFIGWLLKRTKMGYEMRAVGLNKDAARFAGINVEKNIVLCMVISGALCGIAGALNITGISPHGISTLAAFENNGFNGLSVAFIAGCSPVACIPASLLFAGLIYGGQTVQQTMGAPSEIISIMIGTIVFCMALGGVIPMLAEHIQRSRAERAEQARKLAAEAGATPVAAAGESGSQKDEDAAEPKAPAEASPKAAEPTDSSEKKGAHGDAREPFARPLHYPHVLHAPRLWRPWRRYLRALRRHEHRHRRHDERRRICRSCRKLRLGQPLDRPSLRWPGRRAGRLAPRSGVRYLQRRPDHLGCCHQPTGPRHRALCLPPHV